MHELCAYDTYITDLDFIVFINLLKFLPFGPKL